MEYDKDELFDFTTDLQDYAFINLEIPKNIENLSDEEMDKYSFPIVHDDPRFSEEAWALLDTMQDELFKHVFIRKNEKRNYDVIKKFKSLDSYAKFINDTSKNDLMRAMLLRVITIDFVIL